MDTLLDRVITLMEKSNIKAAQLTAELGISTSSFTDWKKGKGKPSLDAVIKFSDYFHVSIDYLVHGKEFKQSDNLEFSNSRDGEFLNKLHMLSPELQDKLLYYMDGMIAAMPSNEIEEKRLSV